MEDEIKKEVPQLFALNYVYGDGDNATYLFTSYEAARKFAELGVKENITEVTEVRENRGKEFCAVFAAMPPAIASWRITINPVYFGEYEGAWTM